LATVPDRVPPGPVHPLLAFLVAAALTLFAGGLLADLAYSSTYEIQWNNFAEWLIAGAMVFAGLALLWTLVALLRARNRRGRSFFVFLLLLAIFILGLLNNFLHARDAWGSMPGGLVLSAIVTLLAILTTWFAFSGLRGKVGR